MGRRGYFGKAGSDWESWQRRNCEPLLDSMRRAWRQWAQSRRRGQLGLGELRFVEGNVGFDFGGGDFLDLVGIHGGGFHEERIFQAVDFTKIAEVGFPRKFFVAYFASALPFHDQAGGGVEIKEADVALLAGELQF